MYKKEAFLRPELQLLIYMISKAIREDINLKQINWSVHVLHTLLINTPTTTRSGESVYLILSFPRQRFSLIKTHKHMTQKRTLGYLIFF